jgi:hypothetical protein
MTDPEAASRDMEMIRNETYSELRSAALACEKLARRINLAATRLATQERPEPRRDDPESDRRRAIG